MRAIKANSKLMFVSVLALVLTACGAGERRARRGGVAPPTAAAVAPPAARRSLPPLPSRPLSPQLQAAREQAAATASTLRGLPWESGVGMTELSGWEYGTRTKEVAEVLGGEDLKALSRLVIAGGILPPGTDLATLAISFTAVSAGAAYSPLDRQVLLLAGDSKNSPINSSLLTHEFVHALQDQHFDLLSLLASRPYNFDRTEAAFALVEGDAMNVQRRFESGDAWARRSLDDIARQEDERFREYRQGIGALFPPLLTETFIFRYRDGARFVETLRRARPARTANDIFRSPPRSSEQILHPEKYLAALTGKGGDEPREVSLKEETFAEDGWRAAASTPLGEIGTRGLLMAAVPARDAARAAAGWGGDRAYLFEREGRAPLFVWKTVWDRREDASEFFRAYNTLQRQRATAATNEGINPGGESLTVWRDDEMTIVVRLEEDGVLVMRGAEADLTAALEMARR